MNKPTDLTISTLSQPAKLTKSAVREAEARVALVLDATWRDSDPEIAAKFLQQGDTIEQLTALMRAELLHGLSADWARRGMRGEFYDWCVAGDSSIMGVDKDIPMQDVKKGDIIYAWKNEGLIETLVTDSWESEAQPTITIRTTAGQITCTRNHRLLTPFGWARAGMLRQGETIVSAMSQSPSSQNGTLLSMLRGTSVPKLWETNQCAFNSLWFMCGQKPKQLTTRWNTNDLSNLWREKAIWGAPMFELLSQRNDPTQCPTTRSDDTRSQEQQPDRKNKGQQTAPICKATLGCPESSVPIRVSSREVSSRPSNSSKESSHRSQRELLAQSTRRQKEGFEETRGHTGSRILIGGFMGGPAAPLALATITSIEPGPIIQVFDLTVADGESFVANNLIVHNCFRKLGKDRTYAERRVRVGAMLADTDIPAIVRDQLKMRTMEELIMLATPWDADKLQPSAAQWQKLLAQPDPPSLGDEINRLLGRKEKANAMTILWKRDGTLEAWQDGVVVPIGYLKQPAEDGGLLRRAVQRIVKAARLQVE